MFLKQIALNIFKFYILVNFHVALSVVALYLVFNDYIDLNYLGFLFFSTVFGYNFIRFFNFKGNRFFVRKFILKFSFPVKIALFVSLLLSLYFYFHLDLKAKIALIPLFIISFFYNYNYKYAPFLTLRNNGIVKIMSVAFVWSGLVVWVPVYAHGTRFNEHIFTFIWVFIYILMLTLSFDQRDLYIDDTDLHTIPQLYRKKLLHIYIVLSLILIWTSFFIFNDKELIIGLLFIIISAILGYRSNEHKSFYYTAFWIEALPVFFYLCLKYLA